MTMVQPLAKVAGRVCMNCGGGVSFKPGSDAVECAHCGHVQGIERAEVTNIVEYDFATARTTAPTGPPRRSRPAAARCSARPAVRARS
jgi:hypothetical protein